MQFIYLDESGIGIEPVAVMVGIIADSHRMRVTKEHWSSLLITLSEIIGREIKEIHTRDFYSGNSPWRELDGTRRTAITNAIFTWLQDRKHSIVYTAVDKAKFTNNFANDLFYKDVRTLWRFMALHIALSVQKKYQGSPRGRNRTINHSGHCILIFDNEERHQKNLTDLILNAPEWTDTYYKKLPSQEKFNQIIDVPHFVDSRDVGLIQLADFMCFFLRKHIEFTMGYSSPTYQGEVEKVKGWAEILLQESISKSNIFLNKGRCSCADFFYRYAPECIL